MNKPNVRLITHIQDPEGDSSYAFEVTENFDQVLDHLYPLQQPASALEHRELMQYTRPDGGRVAINPAAISVAYEVIPDES